MSKSTNNAKELIPVPGMEFVDEQNPPASETPAPTAEELAALRNAEFAQPDPETEAILDMSLLSWGEVLQISLKRAEIPEAMKDAREFDRVIKELQNLIAPAIISIPRSWVLPRVAPDYDAIDWSKGESLGLLKSDKFPQILAATEKAGSPQGASGN